MASGGVIGNAVIEVTVDASRIKTGMDTAASSAKTQAAKIAAGTEQIGTTAKKQLSDFTGGVARFGAVIGTFRAFLELGKQIGNMFQSGADRAEQFVNAIDTTNATQALASVNGEIKKLEASLAGATGGGPLSYFETLLGLETPGMIQDQINALRERSTALQGFVNGAAARQLEARTAAVRKQADDEAISRLEGIDRINAEEQRSIKEIDELRKKSKNSDYQDALNRYQTEISISAEKKRQAELATKEREEAEKRLKIENAITDAKNDVLRGAVSTNSDFSASISELAQAVSENSQILRGVR